MSTIIEVVDSIKFTKNAVIVFTQEAAKQPTNEYDMISVAIICGVVLCVILAICITIYEIISYNKEKTIKKLLPNLMKDYDVTKEVLATMIDKNETVKKSIQNLIDEAIDKQVSKDALTKKEKEGK